MTLYPLLMAPYFRSGKDTPWGGSMLRDAFMKDAPEQTGESLEISALENCESMVRSGAHAGQSLSHMHKLWGEALTGAAGVFPLILKLIDAQDAPAPSEPGNSKAWVILNCDAGAKISCGSDEWIDARPGDVHYIPAGQPHAIGAGIQLYEIQPAGEPGEAGALPTHKLRGVTSLCKGGSRTYYISDGNLELCRLNVSGAMPVSDGRMLCLTPLGPCKLRWADGEMELMPFDSVLIPAALEGAVIESEDCKVLMASLPRQDALRAELGYRAEGVAGL